MFECKIPTLPLTGAYCILYTALTLTPKRFVLAFEVIAVLKKEILALYKFICYLLIHFYFIKNPYPCYTT